MFRYPVLIYTICLLLLGFAQAGADSIPSQDAKVRILSSEEPPANYYAESGRFVGISVDIIHALQNELNLKQDIEVYPWARTFETLKRQPNSFAITAGQSPDRIAAGFHFIGPIVSRTHGLYALHKNRTEIKRLSQITELNLQVGGVRGDWRTQYIEAQGISVEKTSDPAQSFKKLISGRIDLLISSDLENSYYAQQDQSFSHRLFSAFLIAKKESYIIASPRTDPQHLKSWTTAFRKLQDNGTMDKIAKKWADKTGMPFRYKKELGIYLHTDPS